MNDICKNIEKYNPNKKQKILIVFNDTIANMLSNKRLNPIVTELFIRRKLNIPLVFITESYFAVPKNISLNSRQYFVTKISHKRVLQQLAFNYSSDINFQDFANLYKVVYFQNLILFWLLILLFHQIILHNLERIF